MKSCQVCGFELKDEEMICRNCGFIFQKEEQPAEVSSELKKRKTATIGVCVAIAVLIIGVIAFLALGSTGVTDSVDFDGEGKENNSTTIPPANESNTIASDTETIWLITKITVSDTLYAEVFYDDWNNVEKVVLFDDDGEKIASEEYSYDTYGNLLRKIYTCGEVERRYEYTYDSEGNLIKEIRFLRDNVYTYRHTYVSDADTLTENIYLNDEENVTEQYVYDAKGNLLRLSSFCDGEELARYEYLYDTEGNILICAKYFGNGKELFHTEYTYDSNDNLLLKTEYNYTEYRYGEEVRSEYTYDADGNILSITAYKNGEKDSSYECFYDSEGNIRREAWDYGENKRNYEYEWEAVGVSSDSVQKIYAQLEYVRTFIRDI